MSYAIGNGSGGVNLQATLSASSAGTFEGEQLVLPHHPITCTGRIGFDEDGSFFCEHAKAPPENQRTQFCLNHSLGILLIELAVKQL